MTTQALISTSVAEGARLPATWRLPSLASPVEAGRIVVSFLDAATTSLGRATHYNSRKEQQRAEIATHEALLGLDRDLYAVLLALPGVTDHARQVGIKNLLGSHRSADGMIDRAMERKLIVRLLASLPATRLLKLFEALCVRSDEEGIRRANNARTRKLVLRTLFASARLELWAVKYRSKLRAALVHVWGLRMTSTVRAILDKDETARTRKERGIIADAIDRYATDGHARIHECVRFVLGSRNRLTLPLFVAFEAAKSDLSAGATLPLEVLEGIRSTYHEAAPKEEALKLNVPSLTTAQKMIVQKRAAKADLDVKMDPADYDAVKLYVYAFEMGMTVEIARALLEKARESAHSFPVRYGTIGVLVDASASMAGSDDQPLRPMAAALALRDMLRNTARAQVVYAGGDVDGLDVMLVRPSGDTGLADGLLDLLDGWPEAVFVISDGYENRTGGRFAEVVAELRRIGITTPIFHLNPVFAAESKGVRELCPGLVPTLPVSRPESMGIALLRGLLEADPLRGIAAVVGLALPAITGESET